MPKQLNLRKVWIVAILDRPGRDDLRRDLGVVKFVVYRVRQIPRNELEINQITWAKFEIHAQGKKTGQPSGFVRYRDKQRCQLLSGVLGRPQREACSHNTKLV
jgi:hypothetical protein